jgi:hypothetical protein
MSNFGWSYPAGCSGTPYDDDPECAVCRGWPDHPDPDSACTCPECPECGEYGNPNCYKEGHMPCPVNTIKSFLDHIGIAPLSGALRAIDKYSLEHVWLVLADGRRLYYHDPSREALDALPLTTRIRSVGAGCIAWDGSDWEASSERTYESHDDVDAVRQDVLDAYAEYHAEFGEE